MNDKRELRRQALPSDIDAQGTVVVWDHGEEDHEGGPVAVRMDVGAANHAMQADPRYAMEADIDDAELAAEIKAIQDRRAEAAKVAEARAAALQLELDRKAAAATVAARRAAKPPADPDPPRGPTAPANKAIRPGFDIDRHNDDALGFTGIDRANA